jgi:tryptophan-rich sensory protein
MILWTILLFHRISRAAAYLLVPYILWVSFASVLTVSLYVLNR